MPHIGAVFDGIDRLTFAEPSKLEQLEEESDDEPKKEKPPTEASSMVAKDGEDVRISAFRGVAVPSRHRRASSSREEVVGGFFFDFGPIRTTSGPSRRVRETAVASMASSTPRRRDGVDAMPCRRDAVDAAARESTRLARAVS